MNTTGDFELVDGFWLPRFVQTKGGVWVSREKAQEIIEAKRINDLFAPWSERREVENSYRVAEINQAFAPGLLDASVVTEAEAIVRYGFG